ncbi:uncharacterized protein LOC100638733 [Amphimedon queenslandica]|uniref:BcatB n=1 Tax=Amphimedon queenslandica TaxID=400682 RepID=E2IJA5_AMPQE|nr:uncharacterized protein LOC100638733 [Amphimedon queenslandica]ADO16577.1 BcatB [Amphimedon queenslandica]|eukprot:NP_001292175.1 uncharacterized protein LOC100638733 [Amphimedon queenslandica]
MESARQSLENFETALLREILQKQLPSCGYTPSSTFSDWRQSHYDSGFASASSTRPQSVLYFDNSASTSNFTTPPQSPPTLNSIIKNRMPFEEWCESATAASSHPLVPNHTIGQSEAQCQSSASLLSGSHLVQLLERIKSSRDEIELQKLVKELYYFCKENGLSGIYDSNGVPVLIDLLKTDINPVLYYTINLIHNVLIEGRDSSIASIRASGGVECMVNKLVHSNYQFIIVLTDALRLITASDKESKIIFSRSGGPRALLQLLKIYRINEKLLWTVSRLLKELSVCSSNKPEIVQAGGMQVLSLHLGHRSNRLVQNILFTLRNLSDAATKQDNLEELLLQLVSFLSSNDVHYLTCAAGVLSNLTCNNAKNKTMVCQLRGIEALLRTIENNTDKGEVIERCVCTLRHITSRHLAAEMAQNAIRELNGIPMLMNLLQPQTRYPLIKALIGLFRNLSLCSDNHTVLREQGCIPKLWQLLNRSFQELQRRSGQPGECLLSNFLECTTCCLYLLAKDPLNRSAMNQLNITPLLVQFLNVVDERVQLFVVKILSKLSLDDERVGLIIDRENGFQYISDLAITSNNNELATAALTLLSLLAFPS